MDNGQRTSQKMAKTILESLPMQCIGQTKRQCNSDVQLPWCLSEYVLYSCLAEWTGPRCERRYSYWPRRKYCNETLLADRDSCFDDILPIYYQLLLSSSYLNLVLVALAVVKDI